jgi:flavin reductase (DIM6/NTAB) family NADH-FMN oxidoreductase RutF
MLKQDFLEGMSRAAATVTVVTTEGRVGRDGVTVSAMTSVSVDPGAPSLLVCLHHLGRAAQAISENGVFCVNLLHDEHGRLADRFAGRLKDEVTDRFAGAVWRVLTTGAPAAADALAAFDCKLLKAERCGSHWIFLGEVVDLMLGDRRAPLIYANRTYRTLSADNEGILPAPTTRSAAKTPTNASR